MCVDDAPTRSKSSSLYMAFQLSASGPKAESIIIPVAALRHHVSRESCLIATTVMSDEVGLPESRWCEKTYTTSSNEKMNVTV